jgi:hypothetical protein
MNSFFGPPSVMSSDGLFVDYGPDSALQFPGSLGANGNSRTNQDRPTDWNAVVRGAIEGWFEGSVVGGISGCTGGAIVGSAGAGVGAGPGCIGGAAIGAFGGGVGGLAQGAMDAYQQQHGSLFPR